MFNWFKRREEKIEGWKNEAKSRNSKFLTVVFNGIDKSEYPVYDIISKNCIEAALRAAPFGSLKYSTEIFDLREPQKIIKKSLLKCGFCGKMNQIVDED